MSLRCSRCGKEIAPGDSSYIIKITALSNFDGVIRIQENADLKALLKQLEEEIKGLPEELIEEEIFKEKEFVLCPICKEIFLANPLGKNLDDLEAPESIPPP